MTDWVEQHASEECIAPAIGSHYEYRPTSIFANLSKDTGQPMECTICGARNVNQHTHYRWHEARGEIK